MPRWMAALLCAGALLGAAESCWAAGWATDDEGALYQVFPGSKEVDKVGTIRAVTIVEGKTVVTTPSLTDIALSDLHGMYGISYTHLYKINLRDPARSERVGRLAGSYAQFNALAFDDEGRLFALEGGTFYSVDRKTGRATRLGSLGGSWTSDGDLAWVGNAFLASVNGMLGCHLVRIDSKTFKATDLGRVRALSAPARTDKNGKKGRTAAPIYFDDVWGLIWDGRVLWALTPGGEILQLDRATAIATPRHRVRATFWGACAMLRI